MKQTVISIVNAVGCLILLGIVISQWSQHETRRKEFRALQVQHHESEQAREEAQRRSDSLETDLSELKIAMMATQKVADEAANAGKQQADLLQETSAARDQANAERDALRAQIAAWETAIKQRDEKITTQNADLTALRKKLDEAIAQLKKAGAR